MKNFLPSLFIIITVVLLLLSSCGITMMEEGKTVNEYIYPYIEFTPLEDGSGYTAIVVSGAKIDTLYIPASIEIDGTVFPVVEFGGFSNPEDNANLKEIVFESSSTVLSDEAAENVAAHSSIIRYKSMEKAETKWNLPTPDNTYDGEFLGWFLTGSDVEIHSGDIMVPGYTTVAARWGKHNYVKGEGKEATCTEEGWTEYEVCTNPGCGYSTRKTIPASGHSLPLLKHLAAAATCITNGYESDWYECTRCHSTFSDENASSPLNIETITIPLSGHTSDGNIYGENDPDNHWWHCCVDDVDYDKEPHSYTEWADSATNPLLRERHCTVCGHTETAEKEHSWEKVEEKESTCTEKGHSGYWRCLVHDGEYTLTVDHSEIINETKLREATDYPLKAHELSEWVITDENEHWKVCSSCIGIFKKGTHEYEYTFSGDTSSRSLVVERKCSVCSKTETGKSSSYSSAFEITAVFGDIKVVTKKTNTWELSYTGGKGSCYWTDQKGNRIIDGSDPFTVTYSASGDGTIKVYCHITDGSGRETDVAFTALSVH